MGAVNLRKAQLAKLKGQVNEISLVTDDGDDTSLSLIPSDMVKFDRLLYELHINVKRHREPMQIPGEEMNNTSRVVWTQGWKI